MGLTLLAEHYASLSHLIKSSKIYDPTAPPIMPLSSPNDMADITRSLAKALDSSSNLEWI
jgi:hypothetical protein